jgi:PAS domain S-box-containing protein
LDIRCLNGRPIPDIFTKVIHDDDREWVFQQTRTSTRTGKEVDYEYRIIDAAGKFTGFGIEAVLIHDRHGNVVGREGVMLDITERKLIRRRTCGSAKNDFATSSKTPAT